MSCILTQYIQGITLTLPGFGLNRTVLSRAPQRPRAQLYAFNQEQAIPTFLLPLKPKDAELLVDMQSLLLQIYNQARYDLVIDYQQDSIPKSAEADRTWVNSLLQAKGLR